MPSERYLDAPQVAALARLRGEAPAWLRTVGPVLDVAFEAANTPRDVRHGLPVVPTGFILLWQVGGVVFADAPERWTTETAAVRVSTAPARARLVFVVTREDPSDA